MKIDSKIEVQIGDAKFIFREMNDKEQIQLSELKEGSTEERTKFFISLLESVENVDLFGEPATPQTLIEKWDSIPPRFKNAIIVPYCKALVDFGKNDMAA